MRIIELKAENVKRLRAVQIRPDGDTVVIAGRNAQGKSSVLDAIWMALAGAAGAKETSRPIRDGETEAQVTLDLGDIVVTRKWSQSGTQLHVAAPDGARHPSPQTMLDSLVGRLSFDPLEFANQPAKEQLATLLGVVALPFDPAELARQRAGIYERRTEVNREGKRVETLLNGLPVAPHGTPDEEVSAAAIAQELEQALRTVEARAKLQERWDDANARVARMTQEVEDAKARLTEAAEIVAEMGRLQVPAEVDPAPIREQLAGVDAINVQVRAKKEKARLAAELELLAAQSAELTSQLDTLDRRKADAVAAAAMPLEGLGFDDDGVLYQGVPFSQASASERLRVGIAMAMALNPEIRVIRITDGSLLDSESMRLIDEMAGAHDFQVWVERVDESGEVGITIEDGQVVDHVSTNGEAELLEALDQVEAEGVAS